VPYGTPSVIGCLADRHHPAVRHCLERAPSRRSGIAGVGSGSHRRMYAPGSADGRSGRLWRLLIGLQISLLIFTLAAPIGTFAADPTEPPPSEQPSAPPPPDPSAPADPSPSAAPTAEPSVEPSAAPDPSA